MSRKDEFDDFLPERKPENYSIEIPAEQRPFENNRIPSGYEPMGEIQLRGRVFSRLASGQVHWWVLITGWIIFGGFALVMIFLAIKSSWLIALIYLASAAIPLIILSRGTIAKVSRRNRRNRYR